MDSESSITTFPRHLWWINFLNAWSWRLSTGDTGPIYGPFTVSFVLNVHKASFPAMVTEGPDCLISADFLGTYRGLLSMQHRAIKCTVPEGICTVVDYDGSAPCSKARRLEEDQSNRGNMRRESGGDRYRGFSSGRGSKWWYQALPSFIRIGKRKGWKEKGPQHERESMVTRSDVPGTEEELKLGIVNTTCLLYTSPSPRD